MWKHVADTRVLGSGRKVATDTSQTSEGNMLTERQCVRVLQSLDLAFKQRRCNMCLEMVRVQSRSCAGKRQNGS